MACLWRVKRCSSSGRTVSQLEAPLFMLRFIDFCRVGDRETFSWAAALSQSWRFLSWSHSSYSIVQRTSHKNIHCFAWGLIQIEDPWLIQSPGIGSQRVWWDWSVSVRQDELAGWIGISPGCLVTHGQLVGAKSSPWKHPQVVAVSLCCQVLFLLDSSTYCKGHGSMQITQREAGY